MKVKASLHLHSNEDPEDGPMMGYSLYDLIDRAAESGFKVLASTCHQKNICQEEHMAYAAEKGVLLIPGVEAEIDGHRHILIINGAADSDYIANIKQLKDFKYNHPEAFIIAPHPNHRQSSLSLKKLKKYRGLIDAAEHSWFYSSLINPNKKTKRVCAELELPFVATADLHVLDYLEADYALIDVEELTAEAVFAAIRDGKFENVSRPKGIIKLMMFAVLIVFWKIKLMK